MTRRESKKPSSSPPSKAIAIRAAQPLRSPKIQDRHLDRLAIVYVRQSTPHQVRENRESRDRQYALLDHAVALGWPRDRVIVIDEDQGQSGRSAADRSGFQRLLAEVTMGHVGLVLGLEMSRLARSSADWHRLLEMCALCGSLLADQDGIYDPTDPNDRLLLGLKGTLSEAEMFTLRNRLERGRRNKAARGELFNGVPMGYVQLASGEVVLDPDEQVRGVVRLIFEKFDELGTAWATFHYLLDSGIQVGLRPSRGPRRGQLVWQRPDRGNVERLLRHPIYAGVYTYGRYQYAGARAGNQHGPACRRVPLDEVPFLKRDHLPAYITWEQFVANQERLRQNRSTAATPGVPRGGSALLSGLITCGSCGCHLRTTYRGRKRGRPYYTCARHLVRGHEQKCFGLRALPVDELVAAEVLRALEPAALELSLKAADDISRERERLDRYWQQQRERSRHEAMRAEQQYQAVEPTNRLVARTLEERWEQALRQVRQVEEDYERFVNASPPRLSDAERERIRALAADIPALWHAAETAAVDRKEIVRCLVARVVVTVQPDSEYAAVAIHWQGGSVTQHTVVRPLGQYEQLRDYPRLIAAVRQWHEEGCRPQEIADRLNEAGFRTPRKQQKFKRSQVHELLHRIGLNYGRTLPERLEKGEWFLSDLADRLGVRSVTLRRWVAREWVHSRWSKRQRCWILWADRDEQKRLRALASAVKVGSNGYRAELTTPRPRRPDPESSNRDKGCATG
jgi:DNA invertase Pin-like site-specific DNA recombinase